MLAILLTVSSREAAASLPPEIERLAEEGAVHLYNLDFDRAIALYQRLCREYPGHPAGWVLLGTADWWRAWHSLARPGDVLTGETDRTLDRAVELARALSSATPADFCEGQFFLGGALGVRAHCALLKGNWLAAVRGARESVLILRPLTGCSPYGDEAYLGLGLYEYTAARLPWTLRWISRLLVGGSMTTQTALGHLEHAATHSRWMRFDAQATLVGLYTQIERTPDKALPHARAMVAERPQSPLAHLYLARALNYSGRFAETIEETARSLATGRDPESTFAGQSAAFEYQQGIALAALGRLEEAKAALSLAADPKGGNPFPGASRLMLGSVLDLTGARTEAVAEYRRVIDRPDNKAQSDLAKRRLKRPYSWADFEGEIHRR